MFSTPWPHPLVAFPVRPNVVVMTACGLGGVGKTTILHQYIHAVGGVYRLRAWFPAESAVALEQVYLLFGEKLGVKSALDNSRAVNLRVADVRTYLEQRTGWLLVFDNAIDPVALDAFVPSHGGTVLISSRHSDWPYGTQCLVNVMRRTEAINLLRQGDCVSADSELATLADALGDLPLALTHAAAFMRKFHTSSASYLKLFRGSAQQDLLQYASRQHEKSVASTWLVTLTILTRPAADLLLACAYLPADRLHRDVLLQWLRLHEPSASEVRLAELLDELADCSMIQLAGSDEKSCSMHRLVQLVLRHQAAASGHLRLLELCRARSEDVLYWYIRDPMSLAMGWYRTALIEESLKLHLAELLPSTDALLGSIGDVAQAATSDASSPLSFFTKRYQEMCPFPDRGLCLEAMEPVITALRTVLTSQEPNPVAEIICQLAGTTAAPHPGNAEKTCLCLALWRYWLHETQEQRNDANRELLMIVLCSFHTAFFLASPFKWEDL